MRVQREFTVANANKQIQIERQKAKKGIEQATGQIQQGKYGQIQIVKKNNKTKSVQCLKNCETLFHNWHENECTVCA